jgi:hypothetical protein
MSHHPSIPKMPLIFCTFTHGFFEQSSFAHLPALVQRSFSALPANNGIQEIISTNSHFDLIPGIRHIPPA